MAHEFKNDILADSMKGLRRYRMINNDDGTISLEDVSEYSQTGTPITAAVMTEIFNGIDGANQNILNLSADVRASNEHFEEKISETEKIVEQVLYTKDVSVEVPALEPGAYKTVTMTFSSLSKIEAAIGKIEDIPLISVPSRAAGNILCYRNEVSMMSDGKTKLVTSWRNIGTTASGLFTASVKILYVKRNRNKE